VRRLISKVEDAAGMERLTELVSAAEPFRPNPFAKRRVLLLLKQKSGAQRPFLKVWSTAVGLTFVVGSAGAGTVWWRARNPLVDPAVIAAPPSMSSPPAPAAPPSAGEQPLPHEATPSSAGEQPLPHEATPSSAGEQPLPPEATPSDTAATESDSPPPKAQPAKRRGAIVHETTAPRAPVTTSGDPVPSPRSAEEGEDPTAVVRAIRALRSERNPAQAEQLLQEYLRTYPHGALAEDALALLIETASALRSASAADRAARYLELYPKGRYRATARRVLSALP